MSDTEAAMSLSIYLLATAFGPLAIGPLSELYGRQVVLHASGIWFFVWNLVCGFASTKETLIASRFLAGFGASAIYSLAGGVLGDIWRPEHRGRSLGMYLLIPLLGAAVGPIIGGFMAERTTWRWMFWSTSIFQGVMVVVSFFSFFETYAPVVLQRRAAKIRKETGNDRYHTATEKLNEGKSSVAVLKQALTRPLRLLAFHPLIQVSSLLTGFNYGIMYVTLSTFSHLWTKQYGQSVEISGLHYIACSLGEIAGAQIGGPLMDYFYKRQATENRSPEARIPLMYPGILLTWGGVLMYGWTAQSHTHWTVVDLGVFIMLFGMQLDDLPLIGYIIDVYGEHTSSAMGAQQFFKSLAAFLFPLFAPAMYDKLGYGKGNSILAIEGKSKVDGMMRLYGSSFAAAITGRSFLVTPLGALGIAGRVSHTTI
ncbi:hypothetical protein NM208_g16843 [Fusarium decemcellulare]|uniref:Uncharacterized protein n=1 Tax=Fusarium decemcellulare TaxID=57161 RepID=A0ACC1R953_9HYPO|nr:hypothetical protein NM208_g16843 [Fusarium decemcellulare]